MVLYTGLKVCLAGAWIAAQASVVVSALYGCVVFLILAAKQFIAKRADAHRLEELTSMIKVCALDGGRACPLSMPPHALCSRVL